MTDDQTTHLRQSMEIYAETVRKLEAIVRLQGERIAALEGRDTRVGATDAAEHPDQAQRPLLSSEAALAGVGVVAGDQGCVACQ